MTKESTSDITMSEVVDSIINASNPAQKAHATRKLNAYVKQQTKKGKNPERVRAAVKAFVSRNNN